MKKIMIVLILGILLIGIIGATLSSSDVRDYIINSFQNTFNIESDPIIIEMNVERYWNINYLSYEEGIWTNIQPLNETTLEIEVVNTLGGGYKFQSAICNITNVNAIEKFEYNPVTDVWSSTGNLQYDLLTNYGFPSEWCSETDGYGFLLFASGNKDRMFRLKFPEGEKKIIMITGSGSEKVDISYSGNVALVNFTASEVGRRNNDTIIMVTNVANLK